MTSPSPPPSAEVLLPPPNPPPRREASLSPHSLGAPSSNRPPANRTPLFVALGAAAALALSGVAIWIASRVFAAHRGFTIDETAVVRVVSGTAAGTGFFVAAPPGGDGALVVTAFHVVDSGSPPLVERILGGAHDERYVEAYPETEIVAFDSERDLAVLRVKNLPPSKVTTLRLAARPERDEPIVSAGFPSSSISKRTALLNKEGKLLDKTKLPAIDHPTGRLVRDNAVDGLLVSTDLEPGFSGGPTVNAKGEVVGVNVLKDTVHRGQNGAVSVTALREILGALPPPSSPTPGNVEGLLKAVQDQVLLLPVDDRARVPEHEIVALAQVPHLRALVGEMRAMEQDASEHDFGSGLKASGRALLGMLLARLPGRGLETYAATSTQQAFRKCEDGARGIRRFLGELDNTGGDAPATDCARLATRALAWDLAAVTLEWSGAPRDYSVTRIDEVDPDAHVYRASVKMSGVASLVPVYVTWDGGRLRLELFDKTGRLYALDGSRSAVGHDFEGAWVAKRERAPDAAVTGVFAESEERLVVSVKGTDSVSIAHQYKSARVSGKSGGLFSCNRKPTITDEGSESLIGTLHNGVVNGSSAAVDASAGCKQCGLCMTQHKLFVMKLHAGKLLLYRTNGIAAPEMLELVKE